MSRSRRLSLALLTTAVAVFAADPLSFPEYGVVLSGRGVESRIACTYWRAKDPTDALAVWEALRNPGDKACDAASFCSVDAHGQTLVLDGNYVVRFSGAPTAAQVQDLIKTLPNRTESSLPPVLTFLPRTNLIPGSARYILGPASMREYAPELASVDPGFEQGAEGQVATYKPAGKLALFYYPTPSMARQHYKQFSALPNAFVKRSDVLVAIAYGGITRAQADTLLSRVEYEAKITWNQSIPVPPIKPMFQLLLNILYLSAIIVSICIAGGLIYGGIRVYRRRYGTLESEEAMTILGIGRLN